MINFTTNFWIKCNNCHETLVYPDDSIMIAHRGDVIFEDTRENILEVAKDMDWDIKNHLCPKCK